MAIIRKSRNGTSPNPFLAGVSGKIGDTVVKQYKDKTVIATAPTQKKKKRKPTAVQAGKRDLFKEAVAYARMVMKDPKLTAAYARKLKGKRNVFQAALSEYMRLQGKVY